MHDGRAAGADGFRKRVLYVGTDVLDERLIGRAVDDPDVEDGTLVRDIRALHRVLGDPDEPFAAENILTVVGERLREHLGDRCVARPTDPTTASHRTSAISSTSDRSSPLTLREAERILHVSSTHLVRCFSRAFGIPPHRYLLGRRIDAARRGLLAGEPVAQVAVNVGFHDQAHLTRHFKRHVGTTPARFARSTGRP